MSWTWSALCRGGELVDLRLHDDHYDRSYLKHRPCPRAWAHFFARVRWRTVVFFRKRGIRMKLNWFAPVFRVPIDQTLDEASAQIQAIVRKRVE